MSLVFRAVGRSEVGLVRGNNEDSGFVGRCCLLVADGVGGAAAGEVASATTAYVVSASVGLRAQRKDGEGTNAEQLLGGAVALAQEQVRAGIEAQPTRKGMATTLTAVVADGEQLWWAHLGDSRGYHLGADGLTRVTRDDTWVQNLLDEDRLTPEEIRQHPWRSVVLKSVNGEEAHAPALVRRDAAAGDRVLVASDGLTDLVDDAEIAEVLAARPDDDEAIEALIDLALDRGGHDNITVVLATLVEGAPMAGEGRLLGAATDPFLVVDPTAVRSHA